MGKVSLLRKSRDEEEEKEKLIALDLISKVYSTCTNASDFFFNFF